MKLRTALLATLLASLACDSSAATDQWLQVSSPHFTVLTDAGQNQGRRIVDQFERMRWIFLSMFPKLNVDPASPITVIATKNRKGFQTLEPEAYLAKGQLDLAGLFLKTPDKNYILLRLDTEGEHPYSVVYHEYTHLQFSGAAEWIPIWLNEGIAEFYENTDIHSKDAVLGQPSVNDILFLQQNRLIPLATLFKVDANSPYYHEENKGSIFYAESWALTHYLMVTDRVNGTKRLAAYLASMSQDQDSVAAAQKAFGDLKELQSQLESYIRSGSYKQFVLSTASAPLDEAAYKITAATQVGADAIRADFLAGVDRIGEARLLLDAILKADPGNAQAHETMGSLELREGHIDEARKWYGEAVKLDSQSYLAQYYFASISMSNPNQGDSAEIEAGFRAAIRLNPRFAPAYDQLASFLARRQERLDEAHRLNVQAISLEPGNLYYRLNAANVFLSQQRYKDAAAVLRGASHLAKTSGEAAMVQGRIDMVERLRKAQEESVLHVAEASTASIGQESMTISSAQALPVVVAPKHPSVSEKGPRQEAMGTITNVTCSDTAIEFQLASSTKTYAFFNNDMFKIDFESLGVAIKDGMNPCRDMRGLKARAQYVLATDKTVDGQVVALEFRK